MSRWRPSPEDERWLAVASGLGATEPRAALADRTGGWRSTGPLARIALFALGVVAAALLFGVLGFGSETMLLVAGLAAALAAEWLTVRKRLYASGIEEGLTLAGFLMIGLWIALEVVPGPAFGDAGILVVIAAIGAAGLRRLNPFVTTCAAIGLVWWGGPSALAGALQESIGTSTMEIVIGCGLAAAALALGARAYRRPSHDRMLDWLVATLPIVTYAQHSQLAAIEAQYLANGTGATRLAVVALLLVLGAAMLRAGLKRRRHAPLWGFLGCVTAFAIELRAAIPVAPETWLVAWGIVALVVGAALDRCLREPRGGLTSASLTKGEGTLDLLQMAGSALLAHRAAPEAPTAEPGFDGGGGKFGGGGATGRY